MSRPNRHPHRSSARKRPRRTVVVAILVGSSIALAMIVVGWRLQADSRRPALVPTAAVGDKPVAGQFADAPTTRYWLRVLTSLDSRRALAWSRGQPDLLAAVYAPGSPAGQADRRMLAAYQHRGLRVTGARLQFLHVTITARRVGVVDLRVLDQLGTALAHSPEGRSAALPRDLPTYHRIELRRVGGQWRIARIGLA